MPKGKYIRSKATIEKMSIRQLKLWDEPIYQKMMSDAHKGKPSGMKGKKRLDNRSGMNHPMYGIHKYGVDAPNWRGGKTTLNKIIRECSIYDGWVYNIFERDKYTCQNPNCKHPTGTYLHAHHIKAFSQILTDNNINTLDDALQCKELWDITNGVTFCRLCHKKTNTYGKNVIR